MAGRQGRWVQTKPLTAEQKAVLTTLLEAFITEQLKPRFLPQIRPTAFNYPVDILGKWRGAKYSFITRYRSAYPENLGEEHDFAFTRLDHVEEYTGDPRFHVMWHRHTGQWFQLHSTVSFEQALRLVESEGLLWPL